MPSNIEKFEKSSNESNFSKRTLSNNKNNSKSSINYHTLETTIQIGKSGMTENIIKQIKEIIKKKRVIKVKFLPTAITKDKKELVKELAEKTNTRIAYRIGFTAVLERLK